MHLGKIEQYCVSGMITLAVTIQERDLGIIVDTSLKISVECSAEVKRNYWEGNC